MLVALAASPPPRKLLPHFHWAFPLLLMNHQIPMNSSHLPTVQINPNRISAIAQFVMIKSVLGMLGIFLMIHVILSRFPATIMGCSLVNLARQVKGISSHQILLATLD
jgi:hypothetical protein